MIKYDHTSLACLDRCEQEWVYRHARHLAAPEEAGKAAHFGTMLHLGVQQLSAAKPVELPQWEATDPRYTRSRALRYLELYQEQWLKAPMFEVVWNEGYAESERECALPDRAVRAPDGALYAMDLKSTGMYITSAWQRHFEHNQQVAMQLDILEHVLKEPLAGFWLDAIYVGKAAPSSKDLMRYGPIAYSAELRAELRAQRAVKRNRAEQLRAEPDRAQKRTESCVRYTALCPYFDLCRADPQDREALIQIKKERGALQEAAWEPRLR